MDSLVSDKLEKPVLVNRDIPELFKTISIKELACFLVVTSKLERAGFFTLRRWSNDYFMALGKMDIERRAFIRKKQRCDIAMIFT